MDINRMKLGLLYMFSESHKLSKKSKLQIVNFIENANENQLKVLVMDGEISTSKFDKQTIKIIEQRFNDDEKLNEKLRKASFEAIKKLAS